MSYFAVHLKMKDESLSKEYRPAHLAFLEEQHREKNVAAYGKFADGSGGLIIYRGESLKQVEALVKQDPYVESGARTYDIREWMMNSEDWE
ncbi:YciI family protein [Aliibacillus thermotolerans]|uniref:YciI family protein n=1 Tax=Aliibacillus thermotolerans TaxID=1834418 RepID=A0ABW0U6G7_9BACI|nr:YciI family protein [Aliibacillus thermotolerans]MDA3129141.1 hypothetical protein [Aliibacillus thermotolerans]